MDFVVSLIIAGCSFLLGWMSCSGLYFIKSTRITATVMKMSYVFYLTIINKGLEYLHYAHINRLEALRKNDKSYGHEEYEAVKRDTSIKLYKVTKTIQSPIYSRHTQNSLSSSWSLMTGEGHKDS